MDYIYLPAGTILNNKYLLKKRLADRSNLSVVYLARNIENNKQVVVKEFFPCEFTLRDLDGKTLVCKNSSLKNKFEEEKKLFLNKAKIINKFKSEHIIKCYEYFRENNTAYIITKYYEGKTLGEYLHEHDEITFTKFLESIYFPLLNAVNVVHKNGYIHRDIKPGNIIVSKDKPVLIDFGSAMEDEKNSKNKMVLTPGFSPIEFYSEDAKQGRYSDIYSLAATLYYFFTGVVPKETTNRIIEDDLKVVNKFEEVSNYLNTLIMKNLSLDFDKRDKSIYSFKLKLKKEYFKIKLNKSVLKFKNLISKYKRFLGKSGKNCK